MVSESRLHIETFIDHNFGENAYVLSTEDASGGRVGWVIDPSFSPQPENIVHYLQEYHINMGHIMLTHGHIDHIIGLDVVKEACPQAKVLIGPGDAEMLGNAELNMSAPFGQPMTVQARANGELSPGAEHSLGHLRWQVLDTSGHSPGGISLYCATEGVVFVGDALFAGSIGRCDIPGSDLSRLLSNIRHNLFSLPEETVVFCGHGPKTSIGNERKSNPFLTEH